MANAKCRIYERAAGAGAYCSTCAADIMAKALNPLFDGRRKKLPQTKMSKPSSPVPQQRLFR